MSNETFTHKVSTILIAVGDQVGCYQSVADIPPSLRKRLLRATSGKLAATLLIADERGREEIRKSLEGRPGPVQSRLLEGLARQYRHAAAPAPFRPTWRHWAELALLAGIGACIWILASGRL